MTDDHDGPSERPETLGDVIRRGPRAPMSDETRAALARLTRQLRETRVDVLSPAAVKMVRESQARAASAVGPGPAKVAAAGDPIMKAAKSLDESAMKPSRILAEREAERRRQEEEADERAEAIGRLIAEPIETTADLLRPVLEEIAKSTHATMELQAAQADELGRESKRSRIILGTAIAGVVIGVLGLIITGIGVAVQLIGTPGG
ncbi:hypothetical protein G7075_00060 [Phycicoccus sp. HDW14]|uniref:hypothetical protein n=1 Tax=Phycicoccus sp. HDW14 TaxID=2714941 RepID=UPI00140AE554|nr:hypothetical protein [Phycicoccus sp. HDW14]QIM19890.1 hypothetical protein G7075_00060 [Phycicoccus sp. HDW14]